MPQTTSHTPITTVVRDLADVLARIGTSGDVLRDELTPRTRLHAHATGIGLSIDHATVLVRQIAVFVAEHARTEELEEEREDASRSWDEPHAEYRAGALEGSPAAPR